MSNTDPNWRGFSLTLKRIPDFLNPYAHLGVVFYLVWAGSLPYGNAKAVTVEGILRWFREQKVRGMYQDVDVIVEATSGNTGIVLVYKILPDPFLKIKNVRLVVKSDLPEGKKMPLMIGGANVIPPMQGLNSIATARLMGGGGWVSAGLKSNGNVLNLDQYGHPAGPAAHAEFTGPTIVRMMKEQFDCKPNRWSAGIGSGGSFIGVTQAFRAVLENITATAVLLGPEQEGPGMRTRKEASPPHVTLNWQSVANRQIEVWTRPNYLASMWIGRVTGCPIGVTGGATYMGEIEAIRQEIAAGTLDDSRGSDGKIHSVIFAPDGSGPYGDRFMAHLPLTQWESDGKTPLPWEWDWRGDGLLL